MVPFCTSTLSSKKLVVFFDVHTRENQYLSLMRTMYASVSNNAPSQTHVGAYVVWRVHPPGLFLSYSGKKGKDQQSHISVLWVRATPHTRLRAHDHYTSSALIGGKGGAGPSLLHTTLEGPMEYVNARWMWSPRGFLHGIEWIMFHGHLDYFQKSPLGDKIGRPWHFERSQPLIYFSFIMCEDLHE